MRRLVLAGLANLLVVVGIVAVVPSGSPPAGAAGAAGGQRPCVDSPAPLRYAHVVWIVMENRSYGEVVGHAPYLDSLAAQCGSATNMHNVSHPSQPNYIAMTSGKSLNSLPTNDCPTFCPESGPSIFGQNPSWSVFAESMPTPCLKVDHGTYRTHHTAAPYYRALTNCHSNDLPLTAIIPAGLPAFTMIVPDVVDDMHENTSSVAKGDVWLRAHLPALLATPDYQAGRTAIFVTWDEGGLAGRTTRDCATNTTDQGCHIATLALAKSVAPGLKPAGLLNLYGLLRATEQMLGYPLLGRAGQATSLRTAFGM